MEGRKAVESSEGKKNEECASLNRFLESCREFRESCRVKKNEEGVSVNRFRESRREFERVMMPVALYCIQNRRGDPEGYYPFSDEECEARPTSIAVDKRKLKKKTKGVKVKPIIHGKLKKKTKGVKFKPRFLAIIHAMKRLGK